MLKNILGKKDKKRTIPKPMRESSNKPVPAQRFNDMIEYYTAELKSRLDEIKKLKEDNEMLIKTSLKNASRSDDMRLQVKKLNEDVRILQQRLQDR